MSIFAHDNLLPRIKSYAIVLSYSQLILDAHIFTPGHSNSRQRGEESQLRRALWRPTIFSVQTAG